MERIRRGDRRAFGKLLKRYWPALVSYAIDIVGARDGAEDVVQMVFIRVWNRRRSWTPSGSTSAYLYRITRNLALNTRRDMAAEVKRNERIHRGLSGSPGPNTPECDLHAQALREEVEAAIASLPERRREIFRLSRFHGLSHREISETMGIAPQTVANQMRAALSELRRSLHHHLD